MGTEPEGSSRMDEAHAASYEAHLGAVSLPSTGHLTAAPSYALAGDHAALAQRVREVIAMVGGLLTVSREMINLLEAAADRTSVTTLDGEVAHLKMTVRALWVALALVTVLLSIAVFAR